MKYNIHSHIAKGSIIAFILIIINIIGQTTQLVYESWFGWLSLATFFVGIVLSIIYFGKLEKEELTFSLLFTHGFKAAAVAICIVFVYTLLSVYIVFPGFINKMMEEGILQAKKLGKTEAEIKQYLAIGKKVFLAGSLMVNLFMGALAALIGSLLTKQLFPHPSITKQ